MKKSFALLLALLMIISLTACAQRVETKKPPAETAAPTFTPEPTATPEPLGAGSEAAPDPVSEPADSGFRAVLLGEADFISTDLGGQRLNIRDIRQAVTSDETIPVTAESFAVADLDGDGADEVIVLININNIDGSYEVLHELNGEIYGYTLVYRAFLAPRADGTFEYSSGAADTGVGRLAFFEGMYVIAPLAYSESSGAVVQFYANGKPTSQEEFTAILAQQEQKPYLEWYDLTAENIDSVLP